MDWKASICRIQSSRSLRPSAIIYLGSQIGLGSTIEPFAVINHTFSIGIGTIIGSHAVIEHEVVIGNGCNIRAGAILASRTRIFDDSDKPEAEFYSLYSVRNYVDLDLHDPLQNSRKSLF